MHKLLIAVALAGAAAGAGAQQIYKYTTPAGAIVYTDNPGASLNGAKKLDMPLALYAQPARLYDADRGAPAPSDQAVVPNPATEAVSAAHTELRAARRRRIDGVMPLEGEREGRRFRPEYWQRQRALAQGLVLARANLARAYAQR